MGIYVTVNWAVCGGTCGSLYHMYRGTGKLIAASSQTLSGDSNWEWNTHYTTKYFDVHVTVHRDKFLIIKPTRCTNFSYLRVFLE